LDHDSPFYNEKRAGLFYAQSWALTHMLYLRAGYRGRIAEVLRIAGRGGAGTQGLEQVYGKELALVERDLREYMRRDVRPAAPSVLSADLLAPQ
jgi:hypothetical protein